MRGGTSGRACRQISRRSSRASLGQRVKLCDGVREDLAGDVMGAGVVLDVVPICLVQDELLLPR